MKTTQHHVFAVFFASILAALLTGCGERGPDDLSDILIYGGEAVVDGSWPHVVAVTRQAQDGSHFIECSATLISPKHVLTAGHCLDQAALTANDPDALARIGIYAGNGEEGGKVDMAFPIASVHVNPDLRLHPGGNADLAVIILKEPMRKVRPVTLITSIDQFQELVQDNTAVKLLGFGRREDGGKGRKFMADATARSVKSFESLAGSDGRDSCEGDSGGPGYVASASGKWLQYGIVSRGASFTCGSGGFMTNIAPHACWISEITGLRFADTSVQCATPPAYSEDDLAQIDFMRTCRGNKGVNPFQRETIARLKRYFKTESCEALAEALSSPALKLTELHLRDLSPLAPFTQYEELALEGNMITGAEVLLRFIGLKKLGLAGNDLADPAGSLAPLISSGTRVTGLRAQISNYGNTAFLRLCEAPDTDAAVKHTVAKIKAKTMADDCRTANIRLLMLKTLNLSERGLTDLSPLAGLPFVTTLDLSGNPVSDVSALSELDSLRTLVIKDTAVSDVTPLDPLVDDGLVIRQ